MKGLIENVTEMNAKCDYAAGVSSSRGITIVVRAKVITAMIIPFKMKANWCLHIILR